MLALVEPARPARHPCSGLNAPLRALLEAASTGASMDAAMRSVVHGFGFDSFMYGRFAEPRPGRESRPLLWTTDPREWIDLYDRKAYIEVDPRLTQSDSGATPLVWDGATQRRDRRLARFLVDAARFGIRSGVSVSFRAADHSRIVVALSSPVSPVDPGRHRQIVRRLGDIMLLATRFHDVFMAPAVQLPRTIGPHGLPLSPRERECLQMSAHGLSSTEIGVKLDVTPRTVDFHFSNIIAKLGVLNRNGAIARGISAGLIRIEV
jgi:LuxR family transcriptional regulator, activator of conjugal transfer of Ti plasmids